MDNSDRFGNMKTLPRGISSVALEPNKVEKKRWGTVEIVAFTANYMMGTGFLTLPSAIAKAGLILGSLVLIATGLMSSVAMECVLEATARVVPFQRAEDAARREDSAREETGLAGGGGGGGADGGARQYGSTLDKTDSTAPAPTANAAVGEGPWVIAEERLEMPQLCERWLGEKGRRVYVYTVILYCYMSLWAYAVLAAQTLSVALPLDDDPSDAIFSYWFYLLVFGCCAVSMATQDIAGPFMTALNVTFSYARASMLLLMIVTLLHALTRPMAEVVWDNSVSDDGMDAGGRGSDTSSSNSGGATAGVAQTTAVAASGGDGDDDDTYVPSAPATMFRFAGVVQCLTTSIYSAIFHHSIPTLAEPAADKASVHRAFSLTVALVVVFYLMISIPAILYFGADCLSAVNLNWAHYKPQYWQPLAAFVRNFVVFFPALSLVSSYPLMCITLANNIVSVLSDTHAYAHVPRVVWRVAAGVPPILMAAFISDLGTVSAVTGLFGFALILVFPVLLQRASKSAVEERFGPSASLTVHGSSITRSEWGMKVVEVGGFALTAISAFIVAYQLLLSPLFVLIASEINPDSWG